MLHIIGFSGGLASAVVAKIIIDKFGSNNTILLFHDTKTEPEDNCRFRLEISNYLGVPITDNSDGRNIWEVFIDEGMLCNGRNTMCSRILKQERSMRFMLSHQPAILYIGFTCEEWRRAQYMFARYSAKNVEVKFPLIEQKITKDECRHRVENCWKIKPPQMYKWANHANCIPCVKGKKAYWGLIYMYEKQAWDKAVATEKAFGHTIFTEAGSLEEELENCLRLAKKYLAKKIKQDAQGLLFEYPCECAI